MYTGFLLNILSMVATVIILFVISQNVETTDSDVSVTVSDNSPEWLTYFAIIILLINFVLGFVIYYKNNLSIKNVLSYAYLILSMTSCFMMVLGNSSLFICLAAWSIVVPFIMQMIAGIKFINDTKNNET